MTKRQDLTFHSPGIERPLISGSRAQQERAFRLQVIQPALEFPKRSTARRNAIADIAGKVFVDHQGRERRIPARTVRDWIKRMEDDGFAGLTRKKPKHSGQRLTIVSRAYDAVPLPDARKLQIAHELELYMGGLVKAGETRSIILRLASMKLAELTVAAGFDPGYAELERMCRVPKGLLTRARRNLPKVHRYRSDRKAYEDARPRILRTRDGLEPCDVIMCDVHPIDVLVRRPDGSTATPRGIAWLDLATNRIWFDAVLLEKGEGIRNAHVIDSFIRIVHAWGAPTTLYLDNGAEYNWAAFIDDALQLIDRDGRRLVGRVMPWPERDSNIVRAQPYNAAAKPIEGIFRVLERHYFHMIPGWIGGDRMRKKSANVGREPDPFPGTFEQLRTLIAAHVEMYHQTPQSGALDGTSPFEAYQAFIDQGWGKVDVDPDALAVAFSTEESRQVRQGRIRCAGKLWTCRELQAYQGDRVSVLIPKYDRWSRLPIRDDHGQLLGFAEEDRPFAILDPAGAVEADARSKVHRQAVRALDRTVPDVDPLAERITYLRGRTPEPEAPIVARISPSDEAAEIVKGLRESPDERFEREADERSRRLKQMLALYEKKPKQVANDD